VVTIAESTRVFILLSLIVVILGFGVMGLSDPSDHFPFTTPRILTWVIVYIVALLLSLLLSGVSCVERPRNSRPGHRRRRSIPQRGKQTSLRAPWVLRNRL
jgi:hypothetical protein